MTSDQRPRTTLRELAARLGCVHSALSKAVRAGRVTDGVRLDARNRVVVTDAGAAAAQWRVMHVPQLDELIRREQAAKEAKAAANVDPDGRQIVALDLLAFVIVRAAIATEPAVAFTKRIRERLREAVADNYADEVASAYALSLLTELVVGALEADKGRR